MMRFALLMILLVTIAPLQAASVASYGATPNDSNYDKTAIQNCINANTSVYFPGGEYWIDGQLTIPAGCTLYGPTSGTAAKIRVRYDSGLDNVNYSNAALYILGNSVTIQNLIIDKDFIDGSYGIGILAYGRDGITIDSVEIMDYSVRYGIKLNGCDNFSINNCYIHDFMMNQNNPSGYEADMIQDSPAGILVSECDTGEITNCVIHDIEVGSSGRASISELVPGYGAQLYQSDCMTIVISSNIYIANNDLWNSGELIDLPQSSYCTVTNNVMQMGWFIGIKGIGSQNCEFSSNYIGDCSEGVWIGDHGAVQAFGNLVDQNNFVNCGSRGIWDIAADSFNLNDPATRRMEYIAGVFLENTEYNTITSNSFYNYYGYLTETLHDVNSPNNTFGNNEVYTTTYGPAGGSDVALLGSWTSGLTHAKELAQLNRVLVFFTYARKDNAALDCTGVTYGGKAMMYGGERLVQEGTRYVYISCWYLKQDAINMASSATFVPTWNTTPAYVNYSSAFFENVYQTTPQYSMDTGASTTGNVMACSPCPTHAGDLMFAGAVAAFSGSFTPNLGFTEIMETSGNADGCGVTKVATGASEYASVNHSNMGTGAIFMGVLDKN